MHIPSIGVRLVSGYHVPSGILGSPSSDRSDLALQAAEPSRASCLLGTSCVRAGASPIRRGVPMAVTAALAGWKTARSSPQSWAERSLTICVLSIPGRTAWSPSGRMPAARHAAPSHARGRLQTCPHIDSTASSSHATLVQSAEAPAAHTWSLAENSPTSP